MKQVGKLKKLKSFAMFDQQTIGQITDLDGQVLNNTVNRWIKNSYLIRLKRGLYTTKFFYDENLTSSSYLEFISNKLRYPSYLSLEYVLANHQVISESVFTLTAVTNKSSREYSNKLGRFTFKSIKEDLFLGYKISKKDDFEIFEATKSKALFDYLYFKFFRYKEITKSQLESLRLNLDSFNKNEIKEFNNYCLLTKVKKYTSLIEKVFQK